MCDVVVPVDVRQAVLSQGAQLAAPHASSAHLQAVAQEGRAWARAGDAAETRRALTRLETLVSPLPAPDQPEHHYRYDPPKSQAYVATTLVWVRDAAAEGITREVLAAPDERTAALIALLHALKCEHKIVDPRPYELSRHQLRKRAAEIAQGNWASEAVRQAIDEEIAAGVTVVMGAAAGAAVGFSR